MTTKQTYDIEADRHYLQLLAQTFPTIADAAKEIINLQAIMNLPKGTEHFLADLHGESEAFQHVLKNASGNIKRKVNELFGNDIRESEKKELCTLIYYPEVIVYLVSDLSCTPVVDGGQGHESFVQQRLFVHHLHQTCCVCELVLLFEGFRQSVVIHAVPEQFPVQLDEVKQQGGFLYLSDDADKIVGLVALIVAHNALDGAWPLVFLREVGIGLAGVYPFWL